MWVATESILCSIYGSAEIFLQSSKASALPYMEHNMLFRSVTHINAVYTCIFIYIKSLVSVTVFNYIHRYCDHSLLTLQSISRGVISFLWLIISCAPSVPVASHNISCYHLLLAIRMFKGVQFPIWLFCMNLWEITLLVIQATGVSLVLFGTWTWNRMCLWDSLWVQCAS